MSAGEIVTVRKLNARGEPVFAYTGVIAAVLEAGVRIDAEWTRPRMELGYTSFDPGDRFIEWFYTDRWYNIMEVHTPEGELKGWYCNIAWPATVTRETVSYRDLALDLWVAPNGSALTLDMDEFAADTDMSEDERTQALDGMVALRAHMRRGEAPFDIMISQ